MGLDTGANNSVSVTFDPLDVKDPMVTSPQSADAEQSTRRRILAATFGVLARDGRRKLQLSDVAAAAKVSRRLRPPRWCMSRAVS